MTERTGKGWSRATLDALGVELDGDGRYVFRLHDAAGHAVGTVRYADDGRQPKAKADAGTRRELWPRPEDCAEDTLYVVEGEPDAVSMAELGLPAVALPGAGKVSKDWPERIAHGRECVVLISDADLVGRTRMRSMADKLAPLVPAVYVIDADPERDDGYDIGNRVAAAFEHGGDEAGTVVRQWVADRVTVATPVTSDNGVPFRVPPGEPEGGTAKFTTRAIDLGQLRPVRFTWRPWLIHGRLNLFAGEESSGKSTLQAWLATKVTLGTLPGEFDGRPGDVLYVGADEDDWYEIVTPRLYAMGADLSRVREFVPRDDAAIFNVVDHIAELDRELQAHPFALVVFEQLMDVLPRLKNPNDPVEIRRALRPLRRVLAARDVTGLGTLHVNKGQADHLRQRMQGSMQFGALSRSTVLVDRHPHDEDRRIAILGKANYVAGPVAMSFTVESYRFDLNGREFNIGRVADVQEDDSTMADVLGRGRAGDRERPRDSKRDDVASALTATPQSARAIARAAGIPRSTTERLLDDLAADGEAERTADGWVDHLAQPIGVWASEPPPGSTGPGGSTTDVNHVGHVPDGEQLIPPADRTGGHDFTATPDNAGAEHDDDRDDWRQR